MTDSRRNPDDRKLWPRVTVLNGWVYSVGEIHMGFSLSPSWSPPPDFERTAGASNPSVLRRMHFPAALAWWMEEEFRARRLTSVSIQSAENRWRVYIRLRLHDYEVEELLEVIKNLLGAAELPTGGDRQQADELQVIHQEHPTYTTADALYHWLGNRIRLAVQAIFDAQAAEQE